MTPQRVRQRRVAGASIQAEGQALNGLPTVSVVRPSRFGNPFTMQGCRDAGFVGTDAEIAARVVNAFDAWLTMPDPLWRENWSGPEAEAARAAILDGLPELRGKNLACYCPLDRPCHADVLLRLANVDA